VVAGKNDNPANDTLTGSKSFSYHSKVVGQKCNLSKIYAKKKPNFTLLTQNQKCPATKKSPVRAVKAITLPNQEVTLKENNVIVVKIQTVR
jgi:hypothetical protein